MDGRNKKLLNNVSDAVRDNLQGVVYTHSGLVLAPDKNIVYRYDLEDYKKQGKVALLSGGGSGHEPAMAGYVGTGMLTAAVAGDIFTSPPSNSILTAIRVLGKNNPAGVLIIVMNYTGDRLNFGMAMERAESEGIKVDAVVIGEDCALQTYEKSAGRRGLSGGILAFKIAGAMAEAGKNLEETSSVLRKVITEMGTIGICLSACNIPNSGRSFALQSDEVELGLGVHGEAGVKRLKLLPSKETVKLMFDHMTKQDSASKLQLNRGDRVVLAVNNLGGMSWLEMNVVVKDAVEYLASCIGVVVERVFCAALITSLEMAGVLLTVLKSNAEIISYLDAFTEAPAWPRSYLSQPSKREFSASTDTLVDNLLRSGLSTSGPQLQKGGESKLKLSVTNACLALIENNDLLNKLDRESGDGDCGSTLKKGAEAILEYLSTTPNLSHPKDVLLSMSELVENSMGGSSGALYGLFFASAARAFTKDCSAATWCLAVKLGLDAICKFGGAEPGDRTMVDALSATCNVLSELRTGHELEGLEASVKATEAAAEATATMKARAGRASYVSEDWLKMPDPGAHAVGIWMRAIYQSLMRN